MYMQQPQQKGLLWDNAKNSHGRRPNTDPWDVQAYVLLPISVSFSLDVIFWAWAH